MNRNRTIGLDAMGALMLVGAIACGNDLGKIADEACACADLACYEKVQEKLDKAYAKAGSDPDERKSVHKAVDTKKMTKCRNELEAKNFANELQAKTAAKEWAEAVRKCSSSNVDKSDARLQACRAFWKDHVDEIFADETANNSFVDACRRRQGSEALSKACDEILTARLAERTKELESIRETGKGEGGISCPTRIAEAMKKDKNAMRTLCAEARLSRSLAGAAKADDATRQRSCDNMKSQIGRLAKDRPWTATATERFASLCNK